MAAQEDSDQESPQRHDAEEPGGDPACWLRRVCQACGAMAEQDPPTTCPACGAAMTAD
jgi:rubrerythrin